MSDHDTMNHNSTSQDVGNENDELAERDRGSPDKRWMGMMKSRFFQMAVVAAAFVGGFLLLRKLGVGGSILPGIGLAAFMLVGSSFMHSGHGSRRGHGSHGGYGSSGGHGGCGGGGHQSHPSEHSADRAKEGTGSATSEVTRSTDPEPQWPSRHHGCH